MQAPVNVILGQVYTYSQWPAGHVDYCANYLNLSGEEPTSTTSDGMCSAPWAASPVTWEDV